MEDLGFESEVNEYDRCKISLITFAYNNEYIIRMLEKRGQLLKNESYVEAMELQNEVLERLKKDMNIRQNTHRHVKGYHNDNDNDSYSRSCSSANS